MESKTKSEDRTGKRTVASFIQKQFWLINQLNPESPAYNIVSCFEINGALDTSVLEKSINAVIDRYEIFRTTFHLEENVLYQIIIKKLVLKINTIDLSSEMNAHKRQKIDTCVHEIINRPFELDKGPLIKIEVIKKGHDQYVLLIIMHHAIIDLHSKSLFSEELSDFYHLFLTNHSQVSKAAPLQYSSFSLWQQDWFASEQYVSMRTFWQKQLSDKKDLLELPTDNPRPSVQNLHGTAEKIEFDKTFTSAIKVFSRKNKVNSFIVLLSVYFVLLYRYCQQADITVGVPLTNRRQDQHKDIIGCFVNILPIRIKLEPDLSFKEVMRQVRMEMLKAHRNQEMPFESIVQTVNPSRNTRYNPIFQVGFTFEPPMELSLENLNVESLNVNADGAQLDLFATFWETEEYIRGRFQYRTDLFKGATISRFIETFKALCTEVLENSDQTISTFLAQFIDAQLNRSKENTRFQNRAQLRKKSISHRRKKIKNVQC